MRCLWLGAVLWAGSALAPLAQQAPDLSPQEGPLLLPDPGQIVWDIPNRFSPFEALPAPSATFARFAFAAGETPPNWHARLWARDGNGFASPYAEVLNVGGPTPWDTQAQLPTAPVLAWIEGERRADARINIRLSYPFDGPCRWEAGETRILAPNCAAITPVSIPQSGLPVSLRLGNSPAAATILVRPKHEVILGLGDSYASGEGNPDQPATWEPWFTPPQGNTRWLVANVGVDHEPHWVDDRCHRSFFSYQSLAALQRASEDPHKLVSFIHLACTGAEIFNGILTPQNEPGVAKGFNRLSQINAAQHALCAEPLGLNYGPVDSRVVSDRALEALPRRNGAMLRLLDDFDVSTRAHRSENQTDEPRSGMLDCPDGALRAPDLVMISVGGNDIGFGDLIRYFLVPVTFDLTLLSRIVLPDICPDPKFRYGDPELAATSHCARRDAVNGYHTGSLIGDPGAPSGLQARYALMVEMLKHYLEVSAPQIASVQYPDPLRRGIRLPPSALEITRPGSALELAAEATLPEGPVAPQTPPVTRDPACSRVLIEPHLIEGSAPGLDPLSPWAALSARDPLEITADWAFNLRPSEAINLLRQVDDLRSALANVARDEGLVFACGGRDALVGRGWFAGERLNLPSHGAPEDRWAPSTWQPYAATPEGRAIRTANDSFLTQRNVTGAVHPNLVGHALLAELLLLELAKR